MVKTNWHDVDQIGREIRRIMKDMNTKYHNLKESNPQMALAYGDAYLRHVKAITPFIEMYTGIDKIIKAGAKIEGNISIQT